MNRTNDRPRRHPRKAAENDNRAVGYIRVSTEEQARGGVSLEIQENRIRIYCDHKGLCLVSVIRDEGVSASKPLANRIGGSQLLDAVTSEGLGNVVGLKLDRLFRSASDALIETKRWDRAGVALHLVDQGGASIDTKNSMGKLFFTMLAALAEFERDLIAERTTAAMQHKKRQRRVYSPTPFGYDRRGDGLVENPGELAVIARIRRWREEGASLRKIAAMLTQAGIPTKNSKKWHGSTISYLLRNSLYARPA